MKDEDLLQCPLLKGLDAMHRAQLIGLLHHSSVREKLEECLQARAAANHDCKDEGCGESSKASPLKDPRAWRRSHKE